MVSTLFPSTHSASMYEERSTGMWLPQNSPPIFLPARAALLPFNPFTPPYHSFFISSIHPTYDSLVGQTHTRKPLNAIMEAVPAHAEPTLTPNRSRRAATTQAHIDPFYQSTPRTNPSGMSAAMAAMQQVSRFFLIRQRAF